MRKLMICLLCLLLAAGCTSGDADAPLPTIMNLAAATATTGTASEPDASTTASNTVQATDNTEPASTSRQTATSTPTITAEPSTNTPTASPQDEQTAAATTPPATPIPVQSVRISTVTPIPVGAAVIPPPIPVLAADVIINESEFQDALNAQLSAIPEIQTAQVDFIAGQGIDVRMTATGDSVIVTGDVSIGFQLSGGLVAISIRDVSVGSGAIPQAFAQVAQDQLFTLVVETFDSLLADKLGPEHDLEQLAFTDDTIQLMLLIPE